MNSYRRTPESGEVLLSPEPKRHCTICNQSAPMVVAQSFHRHGFALTPDPGGWMHVLFPWPTLEVLRNSAVDLFREAQLMCPPCAGEVAKFIAHRRVPMLSDEDTIG